MAGLTSNGKVTDTDLADAMPANAGENARAIGIINYETVVTDAGELPFDKEFFDAVRAGASGKSYDGF